MTPEWRQFLADQGAAPDSAGDIAHFGAPQDELQAAAQATIMADLSHLGLLQVEGADAASFLQGQLTNDVHLLDGSNSQLAGYCSPKGRLLAIFLVYAHHGHFHLQFNGSLGTALLKRLRMYVLRAQTTISDVSDRIIRIGAAGAEAETALHQVFGSVPQQAHQLLNLETVNLLRLPGTLPRFEAFVAPQHAGAVWTRLRQHCTAVGKPAWEWLEISAGIPDITIATQDTLVPQMANLDTLGGISFNKGCYTGQEIVARTHYLGKVKRRTQLAHCVGDAAPMPGDPLYAGTEIAGMVMRAAAAPGGGYDLLAEVRLDSLTDAGLRLQTPQGPALKLEQ